MADEQKSDEQKKTDGAGKIDFTPEQQAQIQTLIDGAYTKAFNKADAKYKAEADTLKAQIAEAEALKNKDGGKGNDLTALLSKVAALEKENRETKENAMRDNLKAVAAELGAVSGEEVAMLVSHSIVDGKVVNAEGQPRANKEGNPVSVKELVAEFLAARPYLVKATGAAGAGSSGARGGNGAAKSEVKRKDFEAMAQVERQKFIREGGKTID